MIPPHVVRVSASVRIPSSHGPDVDYEILQAMVSAGPESTVTREAVLLRLIVGNTPQNDCVAEIHHDDLPLVHSHWVKFIEDVLWRRAQAGDQEARAALDRLRMPPASAQPSYTTPPPYATPPPQAGISASGGRYGKAGSENTPYIPIKKEKKPGEAPPLAPIIPGVSTGPRKYFGKIIEEDTPNPPPGADVPAAAAGHSRPSIPERHEVIAFNLATPPTADSLMKPVESHPGDLVVVAPFPLVRKIEEYITGARAGTVHGVPTAFAPIVIRRHERGPAAQKKLRAEIAGGVARMLGTPNGVLWIMPQS